MAELEIGIGKSARRAYSLDDIAIVPSRRTRDPEDVDISWEIDAFRFELPLMAAAMDGVTSPETAIEVGRLGGVGVLNLEGLWTRYDDPEPMFDEIASLPAEKATRRKAVEQQLRHAIDTDSILMHYQVIVDVETEAAVGAEALLRVHDDEGALLSPAEFIDAAESSGLITRLGSMVLQTTCSQLAAWSADGGPAAVQELSVNISPRQLADPDLPQHVRSALNSAGLSPERLCLEITENILIGHQATVDAAVSYLRALGVKIGLDEFGAGQSSLGYLKRFPLDFVKIDRALIAGLVCTPVKSTGLS